MNDRDLKSHVMLDLSAHGFTLFRNNVGALEDKRGRVVTFGLCPGSSDMIGFRSLTITPDMVGQRLAVFTAIEAKSAKDRLSDTQRVFLRHVRESGGFAMVAREVDGEVVIKDFEG